MENTHALEILKEEMENDDVSVRVNAIHKIPIVTTLMGFEPIKNQLIPYLEGTHPT